MKQLLLAAAAVFSMVATAHAVEISAGSTINFTGNATFNATQVNFVTPTDLKAGTGDFTALGQCTDCVITQTPLTYSPFTAVNNLFSVTNNSLTASLDLVSEAAAPFHNASNTALVLQDNVLLSLSNFDPTPGILTLSVNQATGAISGSFSATGEAIPVGAPEPISLALLGTGLMGLGLVRHRRTVA